MACAACQKARAAFAGAGAAILRGDVRTASQQAALAVGALGEKAQSESARIRALIGGRKTK